MGVFGLGDRINHIFKPDEKINIVKERASKVGIIYGLMMEIEITMRLHLNAENDIDIGEVGDCVKLNEISERYSFGDLLKKFNGEFGKKKLINEEIVELRNILFHGRYLKRNSVELNLIEFSKGKWYKNKNGVFRKKRGHMSIKNEDLYRKIKFKKNLYNFQHLNEIINKLRNYLKEINEMAK